MSYLDERLPASFRGIPFLVETHTTQVGRKTAIYELPFESAGVAHLDLGRKARKYKLKALALEGQLGVQVSLRAQRDALVAAFETPGAGLLIHPVYGRKSVVIVGEVTLVESTESGGKIEIECEFQEARDAAPPLPLPEPKAAMIKAAQQLRAAAGTALQAGFLVHVPDFVAASNIAALDSALTDLQRLNGLVGAVLAVPTHVGNQIEAIANSAAALFHAPQAVYNAFDTATAQLNQSLLTVLLAITGGSRGGLVTPDSLVVASASIGALTVEPTGTTPDRIAERENYSRLLTALRASALGNAAETVANLTFSSANDARNMLQTLTDALDNLADNEIAGVEPDQPIFEALRGLIATSVARLSTVAGTLAELTTHTPVATVPAIVVAFNLYGDATRVDEVLARNPQVVHPMFALGRDPLEVLAP